LRFAGKPAEEVLGQDDTAWFVPANARRVTSEDQRALATGQTETYEHVGTAAGVTRDVTERKAAKAELKQQKDELRTTFDHSPVMIRFMDPSGRFQPVNRHWENVLGWSSGEARRRAIRLEADTSPAQGQGGLR
jgi:PAS domain-containing protein